MYMAPFEADESGDALTDLISQLPGLEPLQTQQQPVEMQAHAATTPAAVWKVRYGAIKFDYPAQHTLHKASIIE